MSSIPHSPVYLKILRMTRRFIEFLGFNHYGQICGLKNSRLRAEKNEDWVFCSGTNRHECHYISHGKPIVLGLTFGPWRRSNGQLLSRRLRPSTPGDTRSFVLSPGGERPQDRFACNLRGKFHLPPGLGQHLSHAAYFSEALGNLKKRWYNS